MSKRVSLTAIEKVMLLFANALNVNEIFAYRSQTRFNQQGSIGRKYYAMLLEFVSNHNIFDLTPAPSFPATKRSYSSIRPHLNKLLPTLLGNGNNQSKSDVDSSIKWRISNKSSKCLAVVEKCGSNETTKTTQIAAHAFGDGFECPKPTFFSVQDYETGEELATFKSTEWTNTCNFVHIEVERDVSIEFMHDQTDEVTQLTTQPLKNVDIKALMRYLYTDERIKSNLANLKDSLKDMKFWYFPTKDQVWTVHHELKKILGFKYVRLWGELFVQSESNPSTVWKFGDLEITSEMEDHTVPSDFNGIMDSKSLIEVIFIFFSNFCNVFEHHYKEMTFK